ncbi:glycosyltransferase, partial [Candidatus Falkowbacteria bacterium]|nr:glycosyltransferase [Candidatus Falkowbacteria bacterium]
MRILLSGGGTMGSVSPLIAVYEKIKKQNPQTEFLFIGTK